MTTEDREGLALVPPTSPGDPNTPGARLAQPQGGEHDPAESWGVGYSEPLPSVENSPHWQEIRT
jgi:hypothetical protein